MRKEKDLLFDEAELARWVQHRRAQLFKVVRRTSPLAMALLADARATPARLLILSAREILNPDERSGFLRPVTIVIRASDHPCGRLGAWEEQGSLCIEAELSPGTAIIVESECAQLLMDRSIPETIMSAMLGRRIGEMIDHPLLACVDAPILSATQNPANGRSILSFAVDAVDYPLSLVIGQTCPTPSFPHAT